MDCVVLNVVEPRFDNIVHLIKLLSEQLKDIQNDLLKIKKEQKLNKDELADQIIHINDKIEVVVNYINKST
jgi:hypothetical protein